MLEQFAYVADIVGVGLVVASLVYLAQQVRQNTSMMRSAAASGFVEMDFNISNSMIENRDVGEIWVKGEKDFDSMDEVDRARMLVFERRALEAWQHNFYMHEEGHRFAKIGIVPTGQVHLIKSNSLNAWDRTYLRPANAVRVGTSGIE